METLDAIATVSELSVAVLGRAGVEAEVKKEIEQAVKAMESRTDDKPDTSFDYVFASPHYEIEKQRAEFLEELRKERTDA